MDALQNQEVKVVEMAAPARNMLTVGDIVIHPDRRAVYKAGKEVYLNRGEFSMLLLMASAPGQVFSKAQLYAVAWGEEYEYGTTSVENIIWRLRQKLEEDPRRPAYIKTVIGTGYRLNDPHREGEGKR